MCCYLAENNAHSSRRSRIRRSKNLKFCVIFLYCLSVCVAIQEIGHHPNIVELLAKDIVENVAVMEQGSSDLSIIVKKCREKGLPAHLVQAWTIGVCAGVSFIHEQGFIHQDLKSPNILVFNDLNVKLCDFGLARRMSSGNGMLRVDRVVCTLWTRAPELLMCESSYSEKIDDWSVGCIILEMIMGRSPFRGDPQYVCSCSQDSHLNFNSDQIGHIFRVVGKSYIYEVCSANCCHLQTAVCVCVRVCVCVCVCVFHVCLSFTVGLYAKQIVVLILFFPCKYRLSDRCRGQADSMLHAHKRLAQGATNAGTDSGNVA
jgi:serine/threonine protein kinase